MAEDLVAGLADEDADAEEYETWVPALHELLALVAKIDAANPGSAILVDRSTVYPVRDFVTRWAAALRTDAEPVADEPREGICDICGTEYPTWYAPNDLWNPVMRRPDGSDVHDFVCPTCFAVWAERAGVATMFVLRDAPEGEPVRRIQEKRDG